mmetsp:Transcript_15953/g.62095  ORF Transcript_15953/g.62095 Transcript_15953/m.62095 type:complete len:210 (-) Transcript_15953:1144-1773(-)
MAFHKMSLILSSHHIRSSKQRTPCRGCSKQLHNWLAPCSTRATKPRGEQACSTWRQVHVESLLLLETNIDDSSPQVLAYTMEELLLAGGLDVWSAPVYMKKGRPGTTLRILCKACDAENLVHLLFKETSSIGVRLQNCERVSLRRHIETVQTRWGSSVRIKVAKIGEATVNAHAEYEDCAEVARSEGVPLADVFREATAAYYFNNPEIV